MAHMIPSLKLYRQLMAEASAPPAAEVTAAQPSASVRPPSHTPLATKLPVLTCLAGWAGATAFRAGAGAHGDVRAGARARGVSHTTRTLKCECELNNNCVTEQAPEFRTVPCQPASHRHLLSTQHARASARALHFVDLDGNIRVEFARARRGDMRPGKRRSSITAGKAQPLAAAI